MPYQSEEWKALDTGERAQLLLVIEGLKKGTIIEGNWTSVPRILAKTGLNYQIITEPGLLEPVMSIGREEDIKKLIRNMLLLPEKADCEGSHRIMGDFLSYPPCCIDEYVRERTGEERQAQQDGKRHLSYRFGRELTALIREKKTYPPAFDYAPPTFTPCSIECGKARDLLGEWGDALERLDPDGAFAIVYPNRSGFPERLAHKEYLAREKLRYERLR